MNRDIQIGDIVKFTIVGHTKTAIIVNILDSRAMLLIVPSQKITEINSVLWLSVNKLKSTGKNIFDVVTTLDWMTKTIQYQQTQTGIDLQPSKELTKAIELLEALKV